MSAFRFRVDENHFENGAFRKRRRRDTRMISLAGKCCVFKFVVWTVDFLF